MGPYVSIGQGNVPLLPHVLFVRNPGPRPISFVRLDLLPEREEKRQHRKTEAGWELLLHGPRDDKGRYVLLTEGP